MSKKILNHIKKGKSLKFNWLIDIANKNNILVYSAELPCTIDGYYHEDPEYKVIFLDLEKLRDQNKLEYVFACLIGNSTYTTQEEVHLYAKSLLYFLDKEIQKPVHSFEDIFNSDSTLISDYKKELAEVYECPQENERNIWYANLLVVR